MLRDVKPIFLCAVSKSEAKIVERILVSVLPQLISLNINISPEMIESEESLMVPEALFVSIKQAAEHLTGFSCDCVER